MTEELFSLKGKVAVLTGGGGILGGAMAAALAGQGAAIVLLDIRADAAAAAAKRIAGLGGRSLAVGADVLDDNSLEAASAKVIDTFGRLDILINAAGGNAPSATTSLDNVERGDLAPGGEGPRSFFDLDAAALRSVFDLNVLGTFLACRAFGRAMAAGGGGVIINVASMAAFRPLTRVPAYSAAKAGVANFTLWLAKHLAPLGIRVNALAPGFFLTEQNRFLLQDDKSGGLTARGEAIIAHTPLGRFGTGEDLAGTLIWLASAGSGFVTGAVIPVDGGFSAWSGV